MRRAEDGSKSSMVDVTRDSSRRDLTRSPRLSSQVYVMIVMGFIFAVGRNLALPFLSQFMDASATQGGLELTTTQIGIVLMAGGLSYTLTCLVTGILCDRFGRKRMMVTSLVPQLICYAAYLYVQTFVQVMAIQLTSNVLGAFYDPAFGAMVADRAQPQRREAVFGYIYMINNVAVVVCPPIGGIIVDSSGFRVPFLYFLFFASISVLILMLFIKESHPQEVVAEKPSAKLSMVLKDRLFMLFCVMGGLTNILYAQFYGLLGVFVQKVGFSHEFLGWLIAVNGATVVVLQILIRRGTMRIGPARAFIIAQLLFTIGFGYFMFSYEVYQFLVADVILTLGEITFFPSSSGFTANLAPPEMRGRYMAMFSLFFSIGGAVATFMSFVVYGQLTDPRLIWGMLGLVGLATLPGYVLLMMRARKRIQISNEK